MTRPSILLYICLYLMYLLNLKLVITEKNLIRRQVHDRNNQGDVEIIAVCSSDCVPEEDIEDYDVLLQQDIEDAYPSRRYSKYYFINPRYFGFTRTCNKPCKILKLFSNDDFNKYRRYEVVSIETIDEDAIEFIKTDLYRAIVATSPHIPPTSHELGPILQLSRVLSTVADSISEKPEFITPAVESISPVADSISEKPEFITPAVEFISTVADSTSEKPEFITPVVESISPVADSISEKPEFITPAVESISPVADSISEKPKLITPAVESISTLIETIPYASKLQKSRPITTVIGPTLSVVGSISPMTQPTLLESGPISPEVGSIQQDVGFISFNVPERNQTLIDILKPEIKPNISKLHSINQNTLSSNNEFKPLRTNSEPVINEPSVNFTNTLDTTSKVQPPIVMVPKMIRVAFLEVEMANAESLKNATYATHEVSTLPPRNEILPLVAKNENSWVLTTENNMFNYTSLQDGIFMFLLNSHPRSYDSVNSISLKAMVEKIKELYTNADSTTQNSDLELMQNYMKNLYITTDSTTQKSDLESIQNEMKELYRTTDSTSQNTDPELIKNELKDLYRTTDSTSQNTDLELIKNELKELYRTTDSTSQNSDLELIQNEMKELYKTNVSTTNNSILELIKNVSVTSGLIDESDVMFSTNTFKMQYESRVTDYFTKATESSLIGEQSNKAPNSTLGVTSEFSDLTSEININTNTTTSIIDKFTNILSTEVHKSVGNTISNLSINISSNVTKENTMDPDYFELLKSIIVEDSENVTTNNMPYSTNSSLILDKNQQ